MRYEIIGTGSKGNALLLEGQILIDCGVAYKKLKDKDIRLALLTHKHSDHFNRATLRQLAEDRPMLRWCCPPDLVLELHGCGVPLAMIDVAAPYDMELDYNFGSVQSFNLIHDVPNVGYIINFCGETAMYATDTGTIDHLNRFAPCDYYFLEANYKEAELEASIQGKLAAGAFAYETRVADTHLSEEQAVKFIAENADPQSRVIYMHRHVESEETK